MNPSIMKALAKMASQLAADDQEGSAKLPGKEMDVTIVKKGAVTPDDQLDADGLVSSDMMHDGADMENGDEPMSHEEAIAELKELSPRIYEALFG